MQFLEKFSRSSDKERTPQDSSPFPPLLKNPAMFIWPGFLPFLTLAIISGAKKEEEGDKVSPTPNLPPKNVGKSPENPG